MLTLGPLVFTTPWILLALGVLPLIYWLLRVTPPAPRLQRFPAIRLLDDRVAQAETPRPCRIGWPPGRHPAVPPEKPHSPAAEGKASEIVRPP